MSGTKGFKPFEYQFEEHHYKGISILQRFYGKRLSSSDRYGADVKLSFLSEMKAKQFYTTQEKIKLNLMREEYLNNKIYSDKKTTP